MLEVDQSISDAVSQIDNKLHDAFLETLGLWCGSIVFTWHWWVNAGLSVLPWVLWVLVRKKESTHRLLLAGFVVLVLSSFLDMLGLNFGLWGYNSIVIPIIPPYIPWDFSIIPVTAMLFYQVKPKVNPYLKALIFSLLGSFVVQPVFEWIGFYNRKAWRDYYSLPLIFAIYLAGHYFAGRKHFEKL
ncbi:hypothetical protein SAMN02745823_00964 [Sporobacter termitidis DSM 10068]|uniref:Uncharacterized protein n=1 Tax=Sporobacter termitidis DSM 10068 TaxID=1123282 RepID=A0A1M5VQH6_9FIRM|nr:CBO0543 family protein [Sporobacter termitidis]SHH77492.1 hypothetical protein SAMN02745823_00964 [Sporobacter termitidis DSM 10068]